MPVYIDFFKKSTRVSGCMPSVCLPHAVPSENRAHFTVKHTELENVKNVRYGKAALLLHVTSKQIARGVEAWEPFRRVAGHQWGPEATAISAWQRLSRFWCWKARSEHTPRERRTPMAGFGAVVLTCCCTLHASKSKREEWRHGTNGIISYPHGPEATARDRQWCIGGQCIA